ncbi:MAG UNVERIFIED_CONTAM: hypothetical protein LVT10_19960 [Anaerolineae bacterium]
MGDGEKRCATVCAFPLPQAKRSGGGSGGGFVGAHPFSNTSPMRLRYNKAWIRKYET